MDWYSIGVAAACGAIAGVIGALAASMFTKKQARPIVSTVVTIVLFSVLFSWAKATIIADHRQQAALAEFEALAEMGDLTAEGIHKARICSVSTEPYEMILARAKDEAATVLRWLLKKALGW